MTSTGITVKSLGVDNVDLKVRFTILSLTNINTLLQQFRVIIRAECVCEGARADLPLGTDLQLTILNKIGKCEEVEKDQWWYEGDDVHFTKTWGAVVSSKMDLHDFPHDIQCLKVTMASMLPLEGKRNPLREPKRVTISMTPDEDPNQHVLKHTALKGFADLWWYTRIDVVQHQSRPDESGDGAIYGRLDVRVRVKRRAAWYKLNVLLPVTLFTILASGAFAYHPVKAGPARLGLVLTMILTTSIFRNGVQNKIPDVPYLTLIDKFFLMMNAYQFLLFAQMVAITWMSRPEYFDFDLQMLELWDARLILVWYSIFVAGSVWWLMLWASRRHDPDKKKKGFKRGATVHTLAAQKKGGGQLALQAESSKTSFNRRLSTKSPTPSALRAAASAASSASGSSSESDGSA